MSRHNILSLLLPFIALLLHPSVQAGNELDRLYSLNKASLIVHSSNPGERVSHNPHRPLVPASTVKVLTALIALQHWGEGHRFTTSFYYDRESAMLWVKGSGDPYLISEELELIALRLKLAMEQQGIDRLNGIGVDNSLIKVGTRADGQSETDNPYDAPLGSFAANFNTLSVDINGSRIESAEPQTQITPTARQLVRGLGNGRHRINLGSAQMGPQYAAELLAAKLRRLKITLPGNDSISGVIQHGGIPTNATLLLDHKNTRPLTVVVAAMLKYSNNFIANQLYLLLGADSFGAPATMVKGKIATTRFIEKTFKWPTFELYDGAGLSRRNRLSAKQLIEVLQQFRPYQYLMPHHRKGFRAKSGTLSGVSTYAGYLDEPGDVNGRLFAVMMNEDVEFRFRERIAAELMPRKPELELSECKQSTASANC